MRHSDTLGAWDSLPLRTSLEQRSEYDRSESEIAAVRHICQAIKSLPSVWKTEQGFAQVCAVLSSQIKESGWGHTVRGEAAQEFLNDAHDVLTEIDGGQR